MSHSVRQGEAPNAPAGSDDPSRNAGFSLVEVMAALVVTCLLMMGLTPFVNQLLLTWARAGTIGVIVDMTSRGIGQLRKDLRHAVPLAARPGVIAFRGDELHFEFPAATGLGAGRGGVEMIAISAEQVEGKELALVRRRSGHVTTESGAEFKDPVVLFSGNLQYIFRYIAQDGTRQSTWSDRPDLPVRIEVTILDGRDPVVPALELPLYADMSVACLIPGAPGCPRASAAAPRASAAPPPGQSLQQLQQQLRRPSQ
jgi:prepilin-type N-terminal cleavage/methylation domain-containing protein